MGRFWLPLGSPELARQDCIATTSQSPAWTCKLAQAPLFVEIEMSSASSAQITTSDARFPQGIQYGAQPPAIQTMQKLEYVVDAAASSRGPALYFQAKYDKVVILPANAFSQSTKAKRQGTPFVDGPQDPAVISSPSGGPQPAIIGSPTQPDATGSNTITIYTGSPTPSSKGHSTFRPHGDSHESTHQFARDSVQPGDRPWYCYWNGTFIEGFIYLTEEQPANTTGANIFSAAPTSTSTHPAAQSTVASTQRSSRTRRHTNGGDFGERHQSNSFPPSFPYATKLIEGRSPNSPVQGYCQQMIINQDGSVSPALNSTSQPITMAISETNPSDSAVQSVFRTPSSTSTGTSPSKRAFVNERLSQVYRRDGNHANDICACQWATF